MSHLSTTIRAETATLERIAHRLSVLSIAFYTCGNPTMGDELDDLSGQIDICKENLLKALKDKIDHDFQQTQQASANVLAAALAGTRLQRGE